MKCFATTNSLQITPTGQVQPCCKFKQAFGGMEKLDDYFALPELVELQQRHHQGDYTKNCNSCLINEQNGRQSRRQMYERIGLGATDFFLDVSMGNYCNLACRMCGPENSTKWQKPHSFLVNHGLEKAQNYKHHMLDKTDISNIVDILRAQTGRVIIEIKGGEPFIMPISQEFFTALATCANSFNFEIWMTSNLTVVPDWWYDLSKEFGVVEFNTSIDGLGHFYKYIRDENQSSENLFMNILELQQLNNHRIRFNIVVQNLNMNNLADLYDRCYFFVGNEKDITLIPLQDPAYYRPNIFPDNQKAAVLDDLEQSEIVNNREFLGIVNYFSQPCDPELWERFINISSALDKHRGQSLCSVMNVT